MPKKGKRIKCNRVELVSAIIDVFERADLADYPVSDRAWVVTELLLHEPQSAAEVTGWPSDEDEFEVFEKDVISKTH